MARISFTCKSRTTLAFLKSLGMSWAALSILVTAVVRYQRKAIQSGHVMRFPAMKS